MSDGKNRPSLVMLGMYDFPFVALQIWNWPIRGGMLRPAGSLESATSTRKSLHARPFHILLRQRSNKARGTFR